MHKEPTREEVEVVLRRLDPDPESNFWPWVAGVAFILGFMLGMLIMGCIR